MLAAKCPGQDRRNWKPEDIFEHPCPHCGSWLEFWKTDAKRTCPQCQEPVLNPKFNLGCALWCAYADQCVGDISSIFTERPDALKDKLEIEVRRYFKGELHRFKLTEEASRVASALLETEKEADPPVVIAAALLHDVGYSRCKEMLDSEEESEEAIERCIRQESGKIAGEIMKDLTLPQPVREKTLEIISGEASARVEKGQDRDEEINVRLWQDILEIARFKQQGAGEAEEKALLKQRLNTENARQRLEQLLEQQ